MTIRKMAVMILLISFLYIFAITFIPMQKEGSEHSKLVLGFLLGSCLGVLVNYYWGDSKKVSTETNAQIQEGKELTEMKDNTPIADKPLYDPPRPSSDLPISPTMIQPRSIK